MRCVAFNDWILRLESCRTPDGEKAGEAGV